MNFKMERTGDWKKAGDILGNLGMNAGRAFDQAAMREAHFFERKLKEGIQSGAPGGHVYRPLSPLSLAIRKFEGFKGKKPLIQSGAMLRSIHVVKRGGLYFVGIDRSAKTEDGESLMDIAQLHEEGASFTVEVTPAARKFLAMVMKEAGLGSGGGGGGGATIAVIRIPARPTFGPIMEMWGKPEDVKKRFEDRVLRILYGMDTRYQKPSPMVEKEDGGFFGALGGLFGGSKKKGASAKSSNPAERDPKTGRYKPRSAKP